MFGQQFRNQNIYLVQKSLNRLIYDFVAKHKITNRSGREGEIFIQL